MSKDPQDQECWPKVTFNSTYAFSSDFNKVNSVLLRGLRSTPRKSISLVRPQISLNNISILDSWKMAATSSEAIMIELMKEGWDWIK